MGGGKEKQKMVKDRGRKEGQTERGRKERKCSKQSVLGKKERAYE